MPPPDYVAPSTTYVAPNVPVPAPGPAPSAYADERQEARAKALAKIMMGYQYRAVQGDNDDKKIWQFRAQHDDARKLLGKSRVLSDDRLLDYQRERGLESADPRSGYVLHDLVERAFGHNFQRGDYDDTDARGDWLARKIPGAIRGVGEGALAQALADFGVQPGEGQQSMGRNYLRGAQQFLAKNNGSYQPGQSDKAGSVGGANTTNPDGTPATLGSMFTGFNDLTGMPLGTVGFGYGLLNSMRFGSPFRNSNYSSYPEMDQYGNAIPGTEIAVNTDTWGDDTSGPSGGGYGGFGGVGGTTGTIGGM